MARKLAMGIHQKIILAMLGTQRKLPQKIVRGAGGSA
jgi:hypothetical protein